MKRKVFTIIKLIVLILFIAFLVKIYLDYSNYKNSSFELKGRDNVYLTIDDKWEDPGFTFTMAGNNRNDLVSTSGEIIYKEGTYVIKYIVKFGFFTKTLERKINVLSIDKEHFYINMNGDKHFYLMKGEKYIDPGIVAFDEIDGVLTQQVAINNNVNENVEGQYEVTYTVTNSALVTKEIKRTVVVYSFNFSSSLKNNTYAKDEEVTIKIKDNRYRYAILPNGEITYNREIKYTFSENGLYSFKFYDTTENSLSYDLEIETIDNEEPHGICELSLYDKSGRIDVQAFDNSGINGYIYYYGSNVSNLLVTNSFSFNTLDNIGSVEIFDLAGNTNKISCKVTNKSTVIPRSYQSYYYNNVGYWLYLPQNNTVRDKVPLLVYLHGDGSKGTDLKLLNNYAFPEFANNGEDFPFIMIAPQCHTDQNFTDDTLMQNIKGIIELVSAKYNVDRNRIIIAGGSSGAAGAYKMAATYKNLFSCLVIGSGVTAGVTDVKELTHLPIWMFHGTKDNRINFEYAKARAQRINALGGNVIFVPVEGGHNVTETAFKDENLISWMISQVKK